MYLNIEKGGTLRVVGGTKINLGGTLRVVKGSKRNVTSIKKKMGGKNGMREAPKEMSQALKKKRKLLREWREIPRKI